MFFYTSTFASMYTLKKSLGQHFLTDENICRKIVEEISKCRFQNLIEVGPGGGALTKYLLQIPGINFKAVELDKEKVIYLKKQYPSLQDNLIHGSFLDMEKPFDETFTVVGNFPYNISTQIVFKIMDWKDSVNCMIGMFQKEVAQRFAAKEGSKVYGVTSVLVQAFFEVNYLFDVSPASFTPPPKVMSGVIKLMPKKDPAKMKSQKKFTLLVKAAFNQRRKTLRNAVKPFFTEDALKDELFAKRAEQLTVEEFGALTYRME